MSIKYGANGLHDGTDETKELAFDVTGVTTGTTRTVTVPDANVDLPEINLTATSNIGLGTGAVDAITTGNYNVGLGDNALTANTTGTQNVAVGAYALDANTISSYSTAVGYNTLSASTEVGHTAVGSSALSACTTASYNTAVGYVAGQSTTTGHRNTFIGYDAGGNTTTGAYNTAIGFNAKSSSATVSGEFTMGDANISNLRCNDTTISSLSDQRDKTSILDIPFGLDYINALTPRMFDWSRRDGMMKGKKDFGFIAQELDAVEQQFGMSEYTRLVHKDNPDKWEADPMKTYPILIKAIQELAAENKALLARIEVLETI